jgi:hypothetical protein
MEGKSGLVAMSARRAAPYLLRQEHWDEAGRLIENMIMRYNSPESLAFALPLLRLIAKATAGTEEELVAAGRLAILLAKAGRIAEAEPMLRDQLERAADQGNYQVANAVAGDLVNLLRRSGRLEEALIVAEGMSRYRAQAGLEPWKQLTNEVRRLQVLADMGQYDEVLAGVHLLRPKVEGLSLESAVPEGLNPWNVCETLLDTGHSAALRSGRWELAIVLNADTVKLKTDRGADAHELARFRFNDSGPLMRLGRYNDAQNLLMSCRAVAEAERDVALLGKVYGSLADLEDKIGVRESAVRFQQIGLGYDYRAGEPEDCASSHNNLANYLKCQGVEPAVVLAHYLAAAAIYLQMGSGLLPRTVCNLAISDLPPRRLPSPKSLSGWRPSRGCASRPSSIGCPARYRTAMPPSPPSGRWWRTRRDAELSKGRSETRCWPRPPRPSGRRSS